MDSTEGWSSRSKAAEINTARLKPKLDTMIVDG